MTGWLNNWAGEWVSEFACARVRVCPYATVAPVAYSPPCSEEEAAVLFCPFLPFFLVVVRLVNIWRAVPPRN
eukprot:13775543-Alexandrium_andersonii.AAC.1